MTTPTWFVDFIREVENSAPYPDVRVKLIGGTFRFLTVDDTGRTHMYQGGLKWKDIGFQKETKR